MPDAAVGALRQFLALPRSEQVLAGQSLALVLAVRLSLHRVPVASLRARLDRVAARRRTRPPVEPARVGQLVAATAGLVPRASCLTQALVADTLLRRDGHPSEIRLGVRRAGSRGLQAHAWAISDGRPVVGGPLEQAYSELGPLDAPAAGTRAVTAPAARWLAGAVHLRGEPLAPDIRAAVAVAPPGVGVPPMQAVASGPAELAVSGVAPHVAPDGTVVALSGAIADAGDDHAAHIAARWARGGAAALEPLVGAYTVAIWDPGEQALTIMRDRVGGVLLVWRRDGDVLRFATTVEQLLDPDEALDPDLDAVAWHIRQGEARLEERTYHAGIRRLSAAHRLETRDGTMTQRRWYGWTQEVPRRRRTPDDAERFRAALAAAVDAAVDRDPAAMQGVLLSGGLDSSAVAPLLAARLHERPKAFSCCYADPEFDERPWSTAVCALHHLEQVQVDCDTTTPFSDLEARLPAWVEPLCEQLEPVVDLAMATAVADGQTRLHWGHGGDHVTAVGSGYVADWVRQGRVRDAIREVRGQAAVRGESFPYRLFASAVYPLVPAPLRLREERRRMRVATTGAPSWMGADLVDRSLPPELPPAGRDSWWHGLRRGLVGGGYGPAHGVIERRGRRIGLEMVTPFFDERVIDLVLALAPDAQYRDGRSKAIFRDAMGDDYPAVVRDRLTKTNIARLVNDTMRREHGPFVRRLVQGAQSVERGWIDGPAFGAAVEQYFAGDDRLRIVLWRALTLEIWLRSDAGRRPGLVLELA